MASLADLFRDTSKHLRDVAKSTNDYALTFYLLAEWNDQMRPAQFVTSSAKIAAETYMPIREVSRSLNRLLSWRMVETTRDGNHIRIAFRPQAEWRHARVKPVTDKRPKSEPGNIRARVIKEPEPEHVRTREEEDMPATFAEFLNDWRKKNAKE